MPLSSQQPTGGPRPGISRSGWLAAVVLLAACGSEPEPSAPNGPVPETATAAAANTWIKRADLPSIPRFGHAAAVVTNPAGQSVLYIIGGAQRGNQPSGPTDEATHKVQAYNVATNTWAFRAALPIDLYKSNGAGVIGGKIYVSGGRQSGDKRYVQALFVYDPAANTWTRKADMPTETWGGMTAVFNDLLYVLTCPSEEDCGFGGVQVLYRYNPATDVWTELSVTPVGIGFPVGGFIGGKLYATGGPAGALLAYDPSTNQWTTKKPMPDPRSSPAGVTLGAKLYVLGGSVDAAGNRTALRTMSVYDPATDSWTNGAQLPTARSELAAGRVVVNGKARIEAVGGARPGNNVQFTP